ncbi:MAG: phage tail protein, partial [Acidimicrobiia bacterium]|nr:phage tail protein [Acidimicrobiia bacterium]
SEITGLSAEVKVEEISEGGQNAFTHKLPGAMSWPNIVLKRGVTSDNTLFDWFAKSSGEKFNQEGNSLTRRSASITLVDPTGTRLRSWTIDGAFPVKWTGPNFSVGSSDMVVEELEIAHHGFSVSD